MYEPIKVGEKVQTGVYVCGEWKPMWLGIVKGLSGDGTVASVDIGSMHGCAPNMRLEQTSHLRREPEECDCAAKDMPFGNCCKATPNMSLKKIAVDMLGAAEALAENDDMQDGMIFSQASQDTFNKASEFMKKAEPLLGEYEDCYRSVLSNLNEDKDGGMFLCAEAKPDYDRAMELSVEIGTLMREYGYAGT